MELTIFILWLYAIITTAGIITKTWQIFPSLS